MNPSVFYRVGAGNVPAQEPARFEASYARASRHAAAELHAGHHHTHAAGGKCHNVVEELVARICI